MRTRLAFTTLAVVALVFVLPTRSLAQEPAQGHLLDAGINLGWAAGIVESERGVNPASAGEIAADLTRAQSHVAAFRGMLRTPYDPAPLAAVERQIARLSSRIGGMSQREAARELNQLRANLRSATSVILSARTGRLVSRPTCDSAIVDAGFYFGQGHTSIQRGNADVERRARDSFRRAIEGGERSARRLGCPFPGSALRGLPMMSNPSADTYRRSLVRAQTSTRRGRTTSTGFRTSSGGTGFDLGGTGDSRSGRGSRSQRGGSTRGRSASGRTGTSAPQPRAERPNLSCTWSSSYGTINWSEGWYGNRSKTLRGSVREEGGRWVWRGRWGRTTSSRSGTVVFTFDSATSFTGYWTEGSSGSQNSWTGSGCR